MLVLISALLVATAIVRAGALVASAFVASRGGLTADRALQFVGIFAPAIEAERDPRAILAWEAFARRIRPMFPEEFAVLDRDAGRTFPFNKAQLQAAHSQWTAEWLGWERTHDTEYKLKAALLEQEVGDSTGSPAARARTDALEREKLDLYQRRYEEYVRVAKALQMLVDG
ncbi:MAG: hypothetical protein EXQ59_01045 [Acidobacteria bacterium]|nr:hypothetical protein [Acidobacteriota bacterium]